MKSFQQFCTYIVIITAIIFLDELIGHYVPFLEDALMTVIASFYVMGKLEKTCQK